MPSGSIIIWTGTIANIPAGWLICDGNNSTPNLLAKFLEGVATAGTDPGTTGGNVSHTHTLPDGGTITSTGTGTYLMNPLTSGSTDGRPPFYDAAFIMKS